MLRRLPGIAFLALFVFSNTSVFGAIVTVQFAGRVTGSQLGFKEGSWMTGCFTYDTTAPDYIQSSTHPIFVISIPQENSHNHWTTYSLSITDNGTMPFPDSTTYDGVFLQFSYPLGFASLSFQTRDTTLFTSNKLPDAIPPLERFDSALERAIYITEEFPPPYRTATMSVEHLVNLPIAPITSQLTSEVVGNNIRIRFTADPTSNYFVESADSLSSPNWTAINEVAGISGEITIPNDPAAAQKFYRIRQAPCPCL